MYANGCRGASRESTAHPEVIMFTYIGDVNLLGRKHAVSGDGVNHFLVGNGQRGTVRFTLPTVL